MSKDYRDGFEWEEFSVNKDLVLELCKGLKAYSGGSASQVNAPIGNNPCRCVIDTNGYYVEFVTMRDPTGKWLEAPYCYSMKEGETLIEASPPSDMIAPHWTGTVWEETGTRTITEEDLEQLRAGKLQMANTAAQQEIHSGVTIELDGEEYNFSYSAEDQANVGEIQLAILSAAIGVPTDFDLSKGIPYHANEELCVPWSQEDFTAIAKALSKNKLYHATYCNHLRDYIKSIKDYDELEAIQYGTELPPDLQVSMAKALGVQL